MMLSRLTITNIALIDALEVQLAPGMNVLSGETGAGKSIIVDAMNLALGERADREMIRTGTQKASVEAWFTGVDGLVADILAQQEISPEGDLVLARELSVSGKNTCRVNGVLTTLGVLKQISDRLVDIHGQHEHQSLLHEKNHLGMLDSTDERIDPARRNVARAYHEYTALQKRLRSLFGDEGDRERRIDVLQFQIDEIRAANISAGEEDTLLQDKKRMNAAESIMDALSGAYETLYDSETGSVLAALKDVSARLQGISGIDEKFGAMAGRVDEAYYTLEEASESVRAGMDESRFDPDALEEMEERLALIGTLKRKYGDPELDGAYLKQAEQELADLIDSEALIEKLTDEMESKRKTLYDLSVKLSELRREAAAGFEQKIKAQLNDLGMAAGQFNVSFGEIKAIDECALGASGIDSVAFYISANRGEPAKPLRKVASGGEVSRIMLALKNVAANKGGIPTMIFDEIDTGISGRMAQAVAEKLKSIASMRQVICVTHLPQIASMADKHFLIEKNSDETSTTTTLQPLQGETRVREVARLAGGESSVSLQHAREMLQSAGTQRG